MDYLLDTSALIAHHRHEAGWEEVQALFADDDAGISIASVTLTEFGRRLRDFGADEAETAAILGDYQLLMTRVLAMDTAVALRALEIGLRTPARLPLIDALIAAAAQASDSVLVHRDPHMAAIPAKLVKQMQLAGKGSA
jgi:predicted nucleic acid-binding protein